MSDNIRSYYARYQRAEGNPNCLLGGVRSGQTCRYQVEADAALRLRDTIELNGGPENCVGYVVPSWLPPEIFRHCHPSIAQGIGGRCFRCGKVLTIEDARVAEPIPMSFEGQLPTTSEEPTC